MNYCFYLEPYTYFKLIDDRCFFYNTLSGERVIKKLSILEQKIIKKVSYKSGYSVRLTNNEYNSIVKSDLFNQLRRNYMAEILHYKSKMPFIVPLERNFKINKFRLNSHSWLTDIYLMPFVDGKTDRKFDSFFYDYSNQINPKWKDCVLAFVKNTDLSYKRIYVPYYVYPELEDCIEKYNPNAIVVLYLNYTKIPAIDKVVRNNKKDIQYKIYIDDVVNISDSIADYLKVLSNKHYTFDIQVSSMDRLNSVLNIISTYTIQHYLLRPKLTDINDDFFVNQVFLHEEDIFSGTVSFNTILRNKNINSQSFGKIYIDGENNVYTNLALDPICTFTGYNFKSILAKITSKKSSWFKIRDWGRCKNCFFQFLCPSPSEFELYTQKSDLCDINNYYII